MPIILDEKYPVFHSTVEMLAPETLSRLLARPVMDVNCCLIMDGHSGLAGAKLSYVNTSLGRYILKQTSRESDWIMFSSDDRHCRSITLWQYGILDQLRPHVEHKIIACARDGNGWALLMDDLTGRVFSGERQMSAEQVLTFLDTLARLHASFWKDPRLLDTRLGLCDIVNILDQTSPRLARKYVNRSFGVLPEWITVGWEAMGTLLEPDVFDAMESLIEDPQPLIKALARYPRTLIHGDYRAENLAFTDLPVVIDWQEASCSLMTIDLAWFARHGYVRNVIGQAETDQYYRQRLEIYLEERFDGTEWQAMIDLGYLMDALRATCFEAYWFKRVENPDGRLYLGNAVKLRNQQVRDALRWMSP